MTMKRRKENKNLKNYKETKNDYKRTQMTTKRYNMTMILTGLGPTSEEWGAF